ncbi:enoyl-CoA hydratase/isomerase family protein [Euzebya sp.]|uniref:enoyl-CoA hydratase/isomerase family protein n=1 Tax=Euzebya sp. TaxID=1971409 RepID=UPI0035156FEF
MELTVDGEVQILTLDADHQVLNPATVAAWGDVLDRIDALEGPAALVITGSGRSFHQGLDLQAMSTLGEGTGDFIRSVHQLFGRLLRLDLPTVAAVNGHAQAAGAMLVQCADLRIMRAERGWFRLPEVELGLPFTVVMQHLLATRLPHPGQHRLMVLGEQVGGADAARLGAVDHAVEGEDAALAVAVDRAAALARFRGPTLHTIRTRLYADLLAVIDADLDRADPFSH